MSARSNSRPKTPSSPQTLICTSLTRLYEGWLRLSLNTPNINQIYPQVGNGGDKDALKV